MKNDDEINKDKSTKDKNDKKVRLQLYKQEELKKQEEKNVNKKPDKVKRAEGVKLLSEKKHEGHKLPLRTEYKKPKLKLHKKPATGTTDDKVAGGASEATTGNNVATTDKTDEDKTKPLVKNMTLSKYKEQKYAELNKPFNTFNTFNINTSSTNLLSSSIKPQIIITNPSLKSENLELNSYNNQFNQNNNQSKLNYQSNQSYNTIQPGQNTISSTPSNNTNSINSTNPTKPTNSTNPTNNTNKEIKPKPKIDNDYIPDRGDKMKLLKYGENKVKVKKVRMSKKQRALQDGEKSLLSYFSKEDRLKLSSFQKNKGGISSLSKIEEKKPKQIKFKKPNQIINNPTININNTNKTKIVDDELGNYYL